MQQASASSRRPRRPPRSGHLVALRRERLGEPEPVGVAAVGVHDQHGTTEAAAAAGDARAETRCAARRTAPAEKRQHNIEIGMPRRGSFRGAEHEGGVPREGREWARPAFLGGGNVAWITRMRYARAHARAPPPEVDPSRPASVARRAAVGVFQENVTRIDRDEKRDGSARTRCAPWRRGRFGWPRGGCGRHRRARGTGGRRRRRTCSCVWGWTQSECTGRQRGACLPGGNCRSAG